MLGMAHEAKWLIPARGDSGIVGWLGRLGRLGRFTAVSWGWIRSKVGPVRR